MSDDDTCTRLRLLDSQIRSLFKQRNPLTRAANLRCLSDEERGRLEFIERRIDELEIEEDGIRQSMAPPIAEKP